MRQALRRLRPEQYPDPRATPLRERLAAANRVEPEQVLVGNGSSELIWLAARALLGPGARALIVGPTFSEYGRAARACGASVVEHRAAPPDFELSLAELPGAIQAWRPQVVFLCNPNNPTGQHLDAGQVAAVVEACGDATLVLDEAYRAFVARSPFGPPPGDVLVLRSMTKDFALAGLRLGYALGPPRLLARMQALQPAWSVSAAAQAAGLAALEDLAHLGRTLAATRRAAGALRRALARLGFAPNRAPVHFMLVRVNEAARWRRALMRYGCLVRDGGSFGLPEYLRIGTRRPLENRHLLAALVQVAAEVEGHG